jgi:cytochrome c biogenesis protein
MASNLPVGRRIWRTLSSVKTGIVLLIVLGVVSATGTFILQRPQTDPDQMARAYSPAVLRALDHVGLTDVFHAWWFVILMALFGLAIICASIDRWPNVWRYFARPYRVPDPHFRGALALQASIPVRHGGTAIDVAERVFRANSLRPQRVVEHGSVSLFAERHRISVLAVYVVHASLLLILLGGIVDALYGYKGFLMLSPGQQTSTLELRDGSKRALPFAIRCDATGQENYPDGTPKKWWSDLVVLEGGKEAQKKQIVVNDPLVTHGIRFYQASYGSTGEVETLTVSVANGADTKNLVLRPDKPVPLDKSAGLMLADFIPDAVEREGQVVMRSRELVNPAIHLAIQTTSSLKPVDTWFFPAEQQFAAFAGLPYKVQATDVTMRHFTGLQVSHEPGQWLVWGGSLLMAFGLSLAFYTVHQRYWAMLVPGDDGQLTLWVGASPDKKREHYPQRFRELIEEIRQGVVAAALSAPEDAKPVLVEA